MVMGPEPTAVSTTFVDESAVPAEQGARGPIEGRSLGRIAWTRLKRDKVAMTGAGVVIFLILVAIFSVRPFGGIVKLLGHPQDQWHQDTIDPNLGGLPINGSTGGISGWGGAGHEFLLGVQPVTGRDMFSMIVSGAQFSLLISFGATLLAVVIGVIAGVTAGYFGGWVDS